MYDIRISYKTNKRRDRLKWSANTHTLAGAYVLYCIFIYIRYACVRDIVYYNSVLCCYTCIGFKNNVIKFLLY